MLKEKTGIGPGLLFMVMYISMFSYGVMHPISVAAKYMGNNGYWGFLMAFIISIPVIALITLLGKRFPKKSVIQYLPEVFGTFTGKFLGLIYLGFIMVLMIWASRAISEEISVYFLSRTPMWVSIFVFLGVAAYIAHQGIEGLTRLAAFIFPVTFLFGILAILFSFQNFQLDNIRPIFLIDGFKIPYGSLHMFYPFIPLLTVLMIYPYLTEKQKSFKVITGATALVFAVIFLVILSGIGNYSAPGISRYSWATLELTRKANLPFALQSFGLFFGATWLSQALVGTGFFYYILSEGMSELLKVLNYKWFTLILFPVTYFLIMLPSGVIDVRYIFPYLRIAGLALTLGLPSVILLVALLRNQGFKNVS
ncbi:GerAB/ArcD/ProY family transporter [Phosphitispora fastidiosa]|uniref:GerAB/ArcD/ProY family transporter n=1 Tax=Phosphitispora fastidiosa TaxID=2837202 RepID=UPI001E50D2E4|nr:endospore germination permease [Phosphitispora fastidiosa]MBU7005164.1 spore germination protein [Phosphitispora fastidiosa]